ncbi:MBL fold metallo-hydrolase [Verrucomicrobiales bacterium]|nr:MBL fold metallo-hydrolase [Verrucomicrobiales bacterium]
MAIDWEILGKRGEDNALLVTIDTGQSQEHLLFDCGEGCLSTVRISTIQSIEHLFFSHFHMDHVSGFDTFFRHNYNRPNGSVNIWGPPGTIDVMSHRFRGFSWNLHHDQPGEWLVHEFSDTDLAKSRFLTREAFDTNEVLPLQPRVKDQPDLKAESFTLKRILLPHGNIPSVGYSLRENEKRNIDPAALQEIGLRPGEWLQALTDESLNNDTKLTIDGKDCELGQLRSKLLETKPGESLAYLTDFRVIPDSPQWHELVDWLKETDTLVCECQYRNADHILAERNGHMTTGLVGQLAREAGVKQLVLHHLSRRYEEAEWDEMRLEVKAEFPRTSIPAN